MKKHGRAPCKGLTLAAISLLLCYQTAHADEVIHPLTSTQQSLLQGTLVRELAPLIKGARVYEGQSRDFPLEVTVTPDRRIILDLGAEAGPHADEELEDFQTRLYNRSMYKADKLGEGSNVDFLYGGRPIEFYSNRPPRPEPKRRTRANFHPGDPAKPH
jgi:hypothetical protein